MNETALVSLEAVERKRIKKESGITLIALVITIIVLLILAGISISTITESGLIEKAAEAKNKSDEKSAEEMVKMILSEYMIEKYTDATPRTFEEFLNEKFENVTNNNDGTYSVVYGKSAFFVKENGSFERANGIIVTVSKTKVLKGQTVNLSATLVGNAKGEVTYSVDNPNIATLNGTTLTAVTGGNVTVTGKIEGTTYESKVTIKVVEQLTAVNVENSTIEVAIGQTKNIKITSKTPNTVFVEEVIFESANPQIATVNETTGVVTGISKYINSGATQIKIKGKESNTELKTITVNVIEQQLADLGINELNYGKKVKYTAKNNVAPNGWRLFYETQEEVYIIYDGYAETLSISGALRTDANEENLNKKYDNGSKISEIGKKLNAKANKAGLFASGITQNGVRATVLMTDPNYWAKYADNTEGYTGAVAIGGPTCELFAASFAKTNSGSNAATLLNITCDSKGYSDPTNDDWFTTDMNNGIYRYSTSITGTWYLASPCYSSSNREYTLRSARDVNGRWNGNITGGPYKVRPIVCIPKSCIKNYAEFIFEK